MGSTPMLPEILMMNTQITSFSFGRHALLWQGDCRQILPRCEGFDALLTDPPYGCSYKSSHNTRKANANNPWTRYVRDENFAPIEGDDVPFDPTPLLDVAGDRPIILWGANYYSDRLPANGAWLIWDKREGSRPNHQADCEMAWSNLPGVPRLFSHLWIGLCRRGEENLSCGGRKLHPNQKPVALMDWMLDQAGVQPGQTVLDPYMGSASLGVACVRRGIRYVGIEIDPTHFETARLRIDDEVDKIERLGLQPVRPAWEVQSDLFRAVKA